MYSFIVGLLASLLLISSSPIALAGGHESESGENAKDKACSVEGHKCADKHRGKRGYRNRHGKERDMFGSELNLSDTQKQDLVALMQLYQPRLEEIRKRGEADRKKLLAMAPDDPAYSELTDAVAEQAAAGVAEVVVLLAELQKNAYGVLDDEQQTKFSELRQSMLDRMEARGKSRGGKGRRGRHGHGGSYGHSSPEHDESAADSAAD